MWALNTKQKIYFLCFCMFWMNEKDVPFLEAIDYINSFSKFAIKSSHFPKLKSSDSYYMVNLFIILFLRNSTICRNLISVIDLIRYTN